MKRDKDYSHELKDIDNSLKQISNILANVCKRVKRIEELVKEK